MSKRKSGKSVKGKRSSSKTKAVGKPKRTVQPKAASDDAGGRREHIEVIARGCLARGSRVLLCRNLKHGYLYLPGGHVEFAESAAAALQREFLEECGVQVRVGALALMSEGVFSTRKKRHHEINLVFHVEQQGAGAGKPITSKEEGIGFEWMELAAVPDADIRPTAAKAWLAAGGGSGAIEWVSEIPA